VKKKPQPGCLHCSKYRPAKFSTIVQMGRVVEQVMTCKAHRGKKLKVRRIA
jgi:hypothetical protein